MTARCWPWSHQYGKWEDHKFYRVRRAPTVSEFMFVNRTDMIDIGEILVQFKTCAMCGKKKSREIKA